MDPAHPRFEILSGDQIANRNFWLCVACVVLLIVLSVQFAEPYSSAPQAGPQFENILRPPSEWEISGALAALNDSDEFVKGWALQKLRLWGALPRVAQQDVLRLLDSKITDAREEAVQAVGILGLQGATEKVKNLLQDARLGPAASEALLRLGDTNERGAVLRIAYGHGYRDEQCPAITTIGALRMRDQIPNLIIELGGNCAQEAEDALAVMRPLESLGNIFPKGNCPDAALRCYEFEKHAITLLGRLGAKEYAPVLISMLKKGEANYAVPVALRLMNAVETQDDLVALLRSDKQDVQEVAILSLWAMNATTHLGDIIPLIESGSPNISLVACQAVHSMSETQYDRKCAEKAFAVIQAGPKRRANRSVTTDIEDVSPDSLDTLAVNTLGVLRAKDFGDRIAQGIEDRSIPEGPGTWSLSRMDRAKYARTILQWPPRPGFQPEYLPKSYEELGPLTLKNDIDPILGLLNNFYLAKGERSRARFLTHYLAGGDKDTEILLRWLGNDKSDVSLSRKEGRAALEVLESAWSRATNFPDLRNDIAEQIAVVASGVGISWQDEDVDLLQRLSNDLGQVHSTRVAAVESVIGLHKTKRWFVRIAAIFALHLLVWGVFIISYPVSPRIQALFFWHKWFRRWLGLGYVGMLITLNPWLRERMFSPFRNSLLVDAHLEEDDVGEVFTDVELTDGSGGRRTLEEMSKQTLPQQVFFEGESGSGKTTFLRLLIRNCRDIAVFLPASDCSIGVVEAIQAKLLGHANDLEFLQTLIYSGAIAIFIDGLNEADSRTLVGIRAFVARNARAKIVVASQPIEWSPPERMVKFSLELLKPEKIERFLLVKKPDGEDQLSCTRAEYELACKGFVAEFTTKDENERKSWAQLLGNPMDLTIVSKLLWRKKKPDLLSLQNQYYELVDHDYKLQNQNPFPLETFSETVYGMKVEGQRYLPDTVSGAEVAVLRKHKMILVRIYPKDDQPVEERYFRHEKIMDFFVVNTFLGKQNRRPRQHLKDNRFAGVYSLLASLMPPDEAATLKDVLIENAADSNNHTVSDRFVRSLAGRRRLLKNTSSVGQVATEI
jgi:HEAT repeat protein